MMDEKERRRFDGRMSLTLQDLRDEAKAEGKRVRTIFALEGDIG